MGGGSKTIKNSIFKQMCQNVRLEVLLEEFAKDVKKIKKIS
ncbi:hypothetical protein HHE03_15900 [Helicobacter heilmannii]|nr:hypothetical protein HHE014_06040 [Helicobacter heilmannii]CRF49909.1 hypothetical protein HHE03_15900 [Helicobacter heilmannii]